MTDIKNDVFVGYKTWNNEKFQAVKEYLNGKGYDFSAKETYTHSPFANTTEYHTQELSGGVVRIKGKLPYREAYDLATELFGKFGKFVFVNGINHTRCGEVIQFLSIVHVPINVRYYVLGHIVCYYINIIQVSF